MNKDIVLCSPGAYPFAEYLYPILDCDFTYLNMPIKAPVVVLFGVFFSFGDVLTPLRDADKRIAIWIGTDVLQLKRYVEGHADFPAYLNRWLHVKLADAPNLADELRDMGIEIDGVVETPPRVILRPMPLPKDFTVGVYAPPGREAFYHTDLCLEIARAMPDVQFRIYGLKRTFKRISDNVWDVGTIDVAAEMPNFSAIIRFTEHDGTAIGPVEFMQAGRRVLTNQAIPCAAQCEPNKDQAIAIIRQLQKASDPDIGASKYWRHRLNHKKWKEQMEKYIG